MSGKIRLTVLVIVVVMVATVTILYAKRFSGDDVNAIPMPPLANAGVWINSKPLTPNDLAGKVVLLDIWEYTCVNCLRTLPYLKEWQRKYADQGLLIVGVHDPEFSFGKSPENVRAFVEANGIQWPIVLDNDFKIWKALNNQYWPRKFLFDHTGKMVYDHIGEGGYDETERVIQALLSARNGKSIDLPTTAIIREEDKPGAFCYPRSPETYAGYERGTIGNSNHPRDQIFTFPAEDSNPDKDTPYLKGAWAISREAMHYAGAGDSDDRLTYRFTGSEVNAVLRIAPDSSNLPLIVDVTLDGEPVPELWRGPDLKLIGGKTELELREPRMYRIIFSDKQHGSHVLKLYPRRSGFELYAFTFGSCTML